MKKYLILFILAFTSLNIFAADFTLKSGSKVRVLIPEGQKPVTSSAFDMLSGDIKTVLNSSVEIVSSKKKADIVDRNKTHYRLLFKPLTKGVESLTYMDRFFIKRERK